MSNNVWRHSQIVWILGVAAVIALIIALTTGFSYGQDVSAGASDDFDELWYARIVDDIEQKVLPVLLTVMMTVITTLAGYAIYWAKRKLGIADEQNSRDTLQTAAANAAGKSLAEHGGVVRETVLDYMRTSAPDAIRHLKPSDDKLFDMARAKVSTVVMLPEPTPSGVSAKVG